METRIHKQQARINCVGKDWRDNQCGRLILQAAVKPGRAV